MKTNQDRGFQPECSVWKRRRKIIRSGFTECRRKAVIRPFRERFRTAVRSLSSKNKIFRILLKFPASFCPIGLKLIILII